MYEGGRARYVCTNCKSRKKACDKGLPVCSACAAHNLPCRYDDGPARAVRRNVGRHFVAFPPSPSDSQPEDEAPSPYSVENLAQACLSIDERFHQQVRIVLQQTQTTFEEVWARFYPRFHGWVPVVEPRTFFHTASQAQTSVPPADFSMLCIAMCLATTASEASVSRFFLYSSAKSLFAQAQAVICSSKSLIQAAIIISAVDYASARPEAAYATIGTAIAMARISGLVASTMLLDASRGCSKTGLEDKESVNIAWALPMMERLILCEMKQKHLRPLTDYPNRSFRPASDLLTAPRTDDHPLDLGPSESHTLLGWPDLGRSCFGRLLQAVSLLDQLLHLQTTFTISEKSKMSELRLLDRRIQKLLTTMMDDDLEVTGIKCSPIAFTVRSLFLLHETLLDMFPDLPCEIRREARQCSVAALRSACKVILDISRHHCSSTLSHKVDSMPLCCYYNIRSSRRYLDVYESAFSEIQTSPDFGLLQAFQDIYMARWML